MHTIKVHSTEREQLIDITNDVRRALKESGVQEGIIVLYVQHTTAGITINENADPDVPRDMLLAFRKLIPQFGMDFKHFEHNSDAHIKSSIVGASAIVPFADGELLLGGWQGIFFCEFDGPRERKVVMIIR